MKKVLISFILITAMLFSCVGVAAAGVEGTYTFEQLVTAYGSRVAKVEGDIQVKTGAEPYGDAITVNASTEFSLKATLSMAYVKQYIERAYDLLNSTNDAVLDGKTVTSDFTFVINFGDGVVIPDAIKTDGSMTGFTGAGLFAETAPRVFDAATNTLTITIGMSGTPTVSAIKGDNIPNTIAFEYAGFKATKTTTVGGTISGTTTIGGEITIDYNFVDASDSASPIVPVNITLASPGSSSSGGGGGKLYTLTYDSNGGTEYKAATYTEGRTVILDKVPEKEGYIFDGWYADKELTKKIDSVKMTESVTVYAAWKLAEGYEPVEVHPVPEMLNGEDHFAYINGYADGTIRPETNITRAEVAAIFFRLLKDEVRDKYLTKENSFVDVNEDDWFNTAVSTMAKAGVVNGRYTDEFVPDEYITRAEFTTICARFDETNTMSENKFSDISFHWAEEYILEAVSYGWITGYEDYTFRPDVFITRAEAVTLINRVVNRNPKTVDAMLDDMKVWTDNSDENAWYYIAIQEAANSHEYAREDSVYETWTQLTENRDWTVYEK